MTNPQDTAPFCIAVALPTHLKSLVERLLQGVLREQPADVARWRLGDAVAADVILRLHGDGTPAISPNLLAEVRGRDGRSHALTIEGAWRSGAMAAALARIAELVVGEPAAARPPIAMQWLQRWTALRREWPAAQLALQVGDRPVAVLGTRQATLHALDREIAATPETLIAAMTRAGWSLTPAGGDAAAAPGVSLKPLLWQLGLQAGAVGALPALQSSAALRLKGWPYLAAGGHRSFAELIRHLRNGDNNRASLLALELAPRAVVDGFLNACVVCEFFHEDLPAPEPRPSASAAAAVAAARQSGDYAAIAAIRRTLGLVRP
ncbi:hypothetical protein [Tahibacter caeni]|uniref:hypothetical protein n=1 Tax=Tahibacter caeni TaxID=1453545 RepID=UPI00214920B0|nr:hypothetical protein [Tahibacter caeni]